MIQFGGTTTVTGTTSNIALGTIPLWAGLSASIVFDADSVNLHIAAGGVPGDYNGDGKVNAADYVVWRNGGSPDSSPAGYNLWRANFGTGGLGAGSGNSTNAAVPEPAAIALVVFGLIGLSSRRRW